MYKIVHKPWGKEEWLELNEFYCYKRIYINAGYKTSYQYHEFKKETNYIISGTAEVWLENDLGVVEKKIMKEGEFFNVHPPKKHRVIALTDLILQEVSTPHVDDVFRINDEFGRDNGKIESEHKTPAVLILTAGLSTRLGSLTKNINKGLLPINNKAIISHIIQKFPENYDFVIALGYKSESLKEYCMLSYPNHKFIFVDIDNFDSDGSGPGYSALKCKEYLKRPFYFITNDCIIDSKIPHLDGNWLGVYPTAFPEKYSTVDIGGNNEIIGFTNKNLNGYNHAFVGFAGIWDYEIFWEQLSGNIKNGELVSAFENYKLYPNFKSKHVSWFDTGNLDDLNHTKKYFKDNPMSLYKVTDEITYNENRFIKFNPNENIILNKTSRAKILNNLIPSNFIEKKYFISYDWEPGKTLYEYDKLSYFLKFLNFFESTIKNSSKKNVSLLPELQEFYIKKTKNRKSDFLKRFNNSYLTEQFKINGVYFQSMENLLSDLDLSSLFDTIFYDKFHGDLQFDNIIFNEDLSKFTYIDWRESFAGNTEFGDIYYDLAKLYGGCIIPYNLIKMSSFLNFSEGSTTISYDYEISDDLKKFKYEYEKWLEFQGFNLNKVKILTGLIFLNMSPLHDDLFSKMLWFKSIEILSNVNQ